MAVKSLWYHLRIRNNHRDKHAKNCYAFLESYKNDDKMRYPNTMELGWAGFGYPMATILPNSHRDLDALTLYANQPNKIFVRSFTTSTEFIPAILSIGKYEMTFKVISDNFQEAKVKVYLKYTGGFSKENIEFKVIKEKE